MTSSDTAGTTPMDTDITSQKIILAGGAGLVGQNLVAQLKQRGCQRLVVLDKHKTNLAILKKMHPEITTEYADLSQAGHWQMHFEGAHAVVMLQAQIGSPNPDDFIRNNLTSTDQVIAAIKRFDVPYTVHISSSVVESVAMDDYTHTKKQQEQQVIESGIPCVVLRPTLMFGWFDRKHLGWLSRFMQKVPVFPIPGDGRYMRQPLYVRDFCNIIISCLEQRLIGKTFNITGREEVDYVDIIREIRHATGSRTLILHIPYSAFLMLLRLWAFFDKNPPFTADQLKALVARDEFEVIDWPGIFSVTPTAFSQAIDETFNDPVYSKVALEF